MKAFLPELIVFLLAHAGIYYLVGGGGSPLPVVRQWLFHAADEIVSEPRDGGAASAAAHADDAVPQSSLLTVSAAEGNLAEIERLLAAGESANAVDSDGLSALFLAAREGHADAVRALVAAGADVNFQSPTEIYVLQAAIVAVHEDIALFLMEQDATDIHAVGLGDFTALHFAAGKDLRRVVTQLLDRGVDINVLAVGNTSALYIAAQQGFGDMVLLLQERGANPFIITRAGTTALDVISEKGLPRLDKMKQAGSQEASSDEDEERRKEEL